MTMEIWHSVAGHALMPLPNHLPAYCLYAILRSGAL